MQVLLLLIYTENVGIYFAEDAVTSLGYVSGATVQGDYQMLLCRVALGAVTQGQSGLRRPPKRLDRSNSLYDSVDGRKFECCY